MKLRLNFIKNWLLTLALILVLSGCFGGETVSLDGYSNDTFSIGVLANWQTVEQGELNENIPPEALVAFISSDPTINITIVREFLAVEASPLEYANANINYAEENILDYDRLGTEEININGQDTRFHVFKGRASAEDLMLKFVQVYLVKDQVGYTVTATLYIDSTQEDVDTLKEVLSSFQFIEQSEE